MKKLLPVFVVLAALFVFAGCCHGEKKCAKLHQHTALCTDDACTDEKKDNASGGSQSAMDDSSQNQDKGKGNGNGAVDRQQISAR